MRVTKSLLLGGALLTVGLWQTRSFADTVYTTTEPAPVETSQTTYAGPNRALLGSGIVAFGVPYAASVIVAAESNHAGDMSLYIPIAGPWIDLAQRGGCPVGAVSCTNETTDKVLLIGDGVLQAIGALSILMSFVEPEREVRQTVTAQAKPTLKLAPVTYRGGSGLAAFGTF